LVNPFHVLPELTRNDNVYIQEKEVVRDVEREDEDSANMASEASGSPAGE
jgi:hypothetical protein